MSAHKELRESEKSFCHFSVGTRNPCARVIKSAHDHPYQGWRARFAVRGGRRLFDN
jgi:hypothetical protein